MHLLVEETAAEISAEAAGDQLWIAAETAGNVTGWLLKPEGLCKGDICIPVPADDRDRFVREDRIDLAAFWRHMGRPAVHSDDGDVWVLGEGADDRSEQLQNLQAPDFSLPDVDGKMHSLSDYRGQKVLLCTWASW